MPGNNPVPILDIDLGDVQDRKRPEHLTLEFRQERNGALWPLNYIPNDA